MEKENTTAQNLNMVLRKLRLFHDMTQRELKERLDYSQALVSELESGTKIVTMETLFRYAEVFNLRASTIMWMAENWGSPFVKSDIPVSPVAEAIMQLAYVLKSEAEGKGSHENSTV